jgi:Ca2+-binding RTX toxin-like protein
MALTYNFDNGGAQSDYASFVHAQHYTSAFETALLDKSQEFVFGGTGLSNNVDLQNIDQQFETFTPGGYDGAYVSTYGAIDDSTVQASLDQAKYVLFKGDIGDEGGVDVVLGGAKAHVIGLTQFDDTINIGGSAGQLVDGGDGNDAIFTGKGNDTLFGGSGDDEIHAGRGNDQVDGGAGNDMLFGDRGDDVLVGGGGEDTIDGGYGFDIGKADGLKADFHYVSGAWFNADSGVMVKNVEYTLVDGPAGDNVLITVSSTADAEVARLFQAIGDQDPTAADYKSALAAFHGGAGLDSVASAIGSSILGDDLTDTLSSTSDKTAFVTTVIHNLYDGSAGEWNASKIADYVSHTSEWEKAKVVADLVHKVADADDHIGIHVDTTSV